MSYLLLVFVLPVALSALVSYRALPIGRRCPQCTGDTLQLLAPRLRLLSAALPLAVLQRRWCIGCGWEGVSRQPRERRRVRRRLGQVWQRALVWRGGAASSRGAQPSRPQPAAAAGTSTRTLDIRSVTVDGTAWRVMLQCWHRTDLFYGRLVFVGPTGRLWLDAVEAFNGTTEREVMVQALSLPDGLLANRLRRLVSSH